MIQEYGSNYITKTIMYDKKFVLDFSYWYHNWLLNSERRDVEIELEKFKRMYNK